jgi:type I restriction enzyme, S subunit
MTPSASYWTRARFGDMAVSVTDRVDVPSTAGVERYVGLEHLDSGSLRIARWGVPSDVDATKLRFASGDIIFGRRRAYQKKVAVADFDGICSAHALVLRANPRVALPEFLPLFMQSDVFFERAVSISVGSLSPTINWKDLARQQFDLPPIDEQRRIATLLWSVEAASRRGDYLLNSLKRLEASTRHIAWNQLGKESMSSKRDRPSVEATTPWVPIREAGEVLLGRQRSPKYQSGRFSRPYLRVANVFDGYLKLDDVLSMDFDDSDFDRYRLRAGDILLNEGQSRELVGRSAIYSGEIEGCCFQNTLIRFRSSPQVMPEFAFAFFQHLFQTGTFSNIASQTTSVAHLGASRFGALRMPVPTLAVQRQVVQSVVGIKTAVSGVSDAIRSTHRLRDVLGLTLLTPGVAPR